MVSPRFSRHKLRYLARASRAIAVQPYEGIQRTLERRSGWRDKHHTPWPYQVEASNEERLHRLLGLQWPCSEAEAFETVWSSALTDLADRGLQVGRGTFGGWDDADPKLGRLVWCVTRHLRPERVVETGVARGLTTRVVLEALARNGHGHLWSVDLPPLIERGLADETGAAVPSHLRDRWTLLSGSSRRHLPQLVHQLQTIELFVHDSMHTSRNMMFELKSVWPAIAPGGVALLDDAERNHAVGQFLKEHPDVVGFLAPADDGAALIACLVRQSGGHG